ncbi:hypothetical protein BJ138DRAFT_1102883 [Hygrophoropsis aurantiaca]|uniref:Uncharacterized protein n=1 Tax=Hygrophoropsis aurantiaca TaxID=72124 RepID=A0ACB8A911_9AGAM|nr:hypothetical protein BJ138DRAFT_1102883 [Hygrophoropsis aurantiaca]
MTDIDSDHRQQLPSGPHSMPPTPTSSFAPLTALISGRSPIFQSMLSLPQPADLETTTSFTPPIIPMQEDRHILEKLLLHCYPGFGISLDSLDEIKIILGAAIKCDMQSIPGGIRKWDSHFTPGWEAEARISAAKVLEVADFTRGATHYVPELEDISAGTYHRLVTYHARCGAVARATVQDFKRFDDAVFNDWTGCSDSDLCSGQSRYVLVGSRHYLLPGWSHTDLRIVGEDLFLRPCASMLNSQLFLNANRDGGPCQYCRFKLVLKLPRIRDMLTARVTKAVSEIQLEFGSPAPQ